MKSINIKLRCAFDLCKYNIKGECRHPLKAANVKVIDPRIGRPLTMFVGDHLSEVCDVTRCDAYVNGRLRP